MPALTLSPALTALVAFTRFTPPQPLHTFLRTTGYKLRPPRPLPHLAQITRSQDAVLASGQSAPHQRASLLAEKRPGPVPTIVLGGFVPDATEQVFLLRGFLLKHGTVYYLNYPRTGFSLDLICAQLDDLVTELNALHGQRPVLFGVSFGAGLILEWLRRSRLSNRAPELSGTIIISPVACAADIVAADEPKPSTLIGRALKPFLDAGSQVAPSVIEKARIIFTKMFEAGAQNQTSLRALMSAAELRHLHASVIAAIQSIDFTGACERLSALRQLPALSAWDGGPRPLSTAPALILYAEKEGAVLHDRSPTRAALSTTLSAFFPSGTHHIVSGGTSPVQHASLIFHYFQFLPPIAGFYRQLKTRNVRLAA
ncbi:MAG: alpha/beta fold hydrolase [Verrucomicrobiota bacterium]